MPQAKPVDTYRFDAVEALVDCPDIQGLYTYRIPKDLKIAPGDIISVPFGQRQLGAIAIRLTSTASISQQDYRLRDIQGLISRGLFSKDYWKLLEQVAAYYQTSLIQVIRTALPPGLLGRSQRRIRLNASPAVASPLSPPAQTLLNGAAAVAPGGLHLAVFNG